MLPPTAARPTAADGLLIPRQPPSINNGSTLAMNAIPHLDAAASAPTVLEIVVGTPVWVWPVLALLLWRGWSATRERTVAAWQVWLMPAVFVVFALARLVEAGFASMALLGLAAGGALGIPVGAMIGRRFPIRRLAEGLRLHGEWLTLAFIVLVFAGRYVDGVVSSIDPALAAGASYRFAMAALSGFFGLVMVSRAAAAFPWQGRHALAARG